MHSEMLNDVRLLDIIEDELIRVCCSSEACSAINVLKQRFDKLHYYEQVFFDGIDSDDAKLRKPCSNDPREFIKLDLESPI